MSELNFEELVQKLHGLPFSFQGLKWKQIVDFVTLASRLKDPILLTQPAGISVSEAPAVLPPSVVTFLQNPSATLHHPAVENCWKTLKMKVWKYLESKVETAFASLSGDLSVAGSTNQTSLRHDSSVSRCTEDIDRGDNNNINLDYT